MMTWPTLDSHVHILMTNKQDPCLSPQPGLQRPSATLNSVTPERQLLPARARCVNFSFSAPQFRRESRQRRSQRRFSQRQPGEVPAVHHFTAPCKVKATPFGCSPQLRHLLPHRRCSAWQTLPGWKAQPEVSGVSLRKPGSGDRSRTGCQRMFA